MHRRQRAARGPLKVMLPANSNFLLISAILWIILTSQSAPVKASGEAWLKSEKFAELGTEIQIPCLLKLPQCVGLHSIKWYRGTDRIFIYSEEGAVTLGNDDISSRMSLVFTKNTTNSFLKIVNITLEDEGLYKCEVTYLAVNRECNNVQHIRLNVTVQPTSVRVVDEDTKQTLEDGRVLGPIIEASKISLRCESGKGRPVPQVEWFMGSKRLKSRASHELEDYGIGTGSGTLSLKVTRSELGATFTCKVSSVALAEPLKIDIKLDVHVRPMTMGIRGVVGHVVQGSKVLLDCLVSGARPPANVTWYNGTELLKIGNPRLDMYDTKFNESSDGTTETASFLAFTATEHDNGRKFSCSATNAVMLKEGSKPMRETATIEVMYPPIVRVSPTNITVNETVDFQLFCEYEANPATLINVIWQLNGKNLTINEERYEGGRTELTSLLVKNATSSDIGKYACILENDFGSSNSTDYIDVSVLYRPSVKVAIEPESVVNEASRVNVSLSCQVLSGNPELLTAVRWYLDGDLLKELPDCSRNSTSAIEEFCDIDPSKLLLESVGRSFHGNYSCEGRNEAGWGAVSPSSPLVVRYRPGPAAISFEPRKIVKKGSLSVECSVADLGRPRASGYKWFRGQHRLADEGRSTYRIDKVRLEDKANVTCMAYNEAGDGEPAGVFLDVAAPPAFIKKLNFYEGFVFDARNVSIECWVECSPLCDIVWMKDNKTIDFSRSQRYYVQNYRHPPNFGADDFESIQSVLHWNLTAWPQGQLDRVADNNVNFTCLSTSNGIGPGVSSSTNFGVLFPPKNMTISRKVVNVVVDHVPESVTCNASSRPDAHFVWYKEGKLEVISEGPVLDFKTPFPRRGNGTYVCRASNRIGNASISTYINVQYKPECQIDKESMDGRDYVVCSAIGNPAESTFTWSLKSDNDTIEQTPRELNGKSYLLLDRSMSSPRTYICIATNSIGSSLSCERHVPAYQGLDSILPWWMRLGGDLLSITLAIIVVMIVVVTVVGALVFMICRRKHTKLKYNSRVVELEQRQHPDGGPPSPSASSRSTQSPSNQTSSPAPRWPLKPGVLVHINRTNSMRSGLSPRIHSGNNSGNANNAINNNNNNNSSNNNNNNSGKPQASNKARRASSKQEPFSVENKRNRSEGEKMVRVPVRAFRRAGKDLNNYAQDDGVLARANRIRAMFSSQMKEADGFPGISRGKTAVTYKRISPKQRASRGSSSLIDLQQLSAKSHPSRKRKRPPAPAAVHGHNANANHMDSLSEGLSEPETKTFYENLPFHGIQSPPNKLLASRNLFPSPSASATSLDRCAAMDNVSPCSTRPPSVCGGVSSGYESTRSHLGPHFNENNMPRNISPEPKYNTLKPRRRKLRHNAQQFYSLRVCKRHRHHHQQQQQQRHRRPSLSQLSDNLEVYAIPIYRGCKHKSASCSTLATSSPRSNESTPKPPRKQLALFPSIPPPPVPAPRHPRKIDLSEHTYQNVPSPIFPKLAAPSLDDTNQLRQPLILLASAASESARAFKDNRQTVETIDISNFRPRESSRSSAVIFSTTYCSTLENGDQLDLYARTIRLALLPKSRS